MKKLTLILLGLIVSLLAISYGGVQFGAKTSQVVSSQAKVLIKEDSFEPQTLTITKGTTVEFINTDSKLHWPASNLHPTHDIYAEFDPKKPLQEGESWKFTFEEPGTWRYHDHIQPFLTGSIIVLDELGRNKNPECQNLAEITDLRIKKICWDYLLNKSLKEVGLKGALSTFADIYRSDTNFAQNGCHWYAHRLGDEFYASEYRKYGNTKELKLPSETYYCGFGFFHGWLEHLVRDEQDTEKAKEVCEYLDKSLSSELPRIRLTCYHAIGHGFVKEPLDPQKWGNLNETVQPALSVCDNITQNNQERIECIQGVFNVLADWMARQEYGLGPILEEDPFEVCEKQSNREHELACYYEISMYLNSIFDHDLTKIAKVVERISDDETAQTVIDVVGAGLVLKMIGQENFDTYIEGCHSLSERLRKRCIIGMSGGFMAHAEPEKEYVDAIKFCESTKLFEDERDVCFGNIIRTFRGSYDSAKFETVCAGIEEKYMEGHYSKEYSIYCKEEYSQNL